MNRDIYSQAEQLNKKHRRKRTWYKILSVPICLVVFVTTYALILPAITMESTPDTYCGKVEPQGLVCTVEEHKHTEACFMNPEGGRQAARPAMMSPLTNRRESCIPGLAAQ